MEEHSRESYYNDGTVACEIEHLLVMRLHELNTVFEIETLKHEIHALMVATFVAGESREVNYGDG